MIHMIPGAQQGDQNDDEKACQENVSPKVNPVWKICSIYSKNLLQKLLLEYDN